MPVIPVIAPPAQKRRFIFRSGEDWAVPCGAVRSTGTCDQIQWWFRASQDSPVVLIPTLPSGPALSTGQTSENCALLLPRVRVEDAGLYTCTVRMMEEVQMHLDVVTCKYRPGVSGCWERGVHVLLQPLAPPSGRKPGSSIQVKNCTIKKTWTPPAVDLQVFLSPQS